MSAKVPKEKGWSNFEYVVLVICTLIVPILGLVVGFVGVFNAAKRQRAASLMGLALVMMALFWVLVLNR